MGKIILIVAHDRARGIGKDNSIPWLGKVSNDMKHFIRVTMGNLVVMGRKTYESIGKPLRGRRNIVLSRTLPEQEGITVVRDYEDLLRFTHNTSRDVYVIGGMEIYRLFLKYADEVIVTEIDGIYDCDTFFPKLSHSNWKLVSTSEGVTDSENIPHQFLKFERNL